MTNQTSSETEAALNRLSSQRPSYDQQLNDERWHKFRRAILRQRNFCESCRQSNVVLQIHHNFYDRNKLAWEYQSNELKVLCSGCHEKFTAELLAFRRDVLPSLTVQAFIVLNRALYIGIQFNDALTIAHALAYVVSNPEQAKRFAAQFAKQ